MIIRWHCPPDRGFWLRTLAVWDQVRSLVVTEASQDYIFYGWAEGNIFFFWKLNTMSWKRTLNTEVTGSSAAHRTHYDPWPRPGDKVTCPFVSVKMTDTCSIFWWPPIILPSERIQATRKTLLASSFDMITPRWANLIQFIWGRFEVSKLIRLDLGCPATHTAASPAPHLETRLLPAPD